MSAPCSDRRFVGRRSSILRWLRAGSKRFRGPSSSVRDRPCPWCRPARPSMAQPLARPGRCVQRGPWRANFLYPARTPEVGPMTYEVSTKSLYRRPWGSSSVGRPSRSFRCVPPPIRRRLRTAAGAWRFRQLRQTVGIAASRAGRVRGPRRRRTYVGKSRAYAGSVGILPSNYKRERRAQADPFASGAQLLALLYGSSAEKIIRPARFVSPASI